jgi:hypothetical protein
LEGKPEGKRPLGKPNWLRLKDKMEKNRKEIKCEGVV